MVKKYSLLLMILVFIAFFSTAVEVISYENMEEEVDMIMPSDAVTVGNMNRVIDLLNSDKWFALSFFLASVIPMLVIMIKTLIEL